MIATLFQIKRKVETHMSTPLLRKRELLVSLRISRSDSVLSDRNLQECRH